MNSFDVTEVLARKVEVNERSRLLDLGVGLRLDAAAGTVSIQRAVERAVERELTVCEPQFSHSVPGQRSAVCS